VEVGQVDVPPNQGEMYITLHWPGSDLDLIMTDPRGRHVDLSSSRVSLAEYEGLAYLIIQNPLPGNWLFEAFGADVPDGLLRFDVIVSVRERTGPPPVNTQVILLIVGLAGGVAVIVEIVVAQQRRPRRAAVGLQVVGRQGSQPFAPLRRRQLIIGRDPRCGMVLADPLVSARHASIQHTPQGYVLTDLGSTHGTFVNGQQMEQALLRGGERLRLGKTYLVFVVPEMQPPSPHSMTGTKVYLAVMSGDQVFGRCAVEPGTVLGRHAGCPVDLSSDALISRQHARLDYQDGRWTITDLNSDNGTFVNGRKVTSQALQYGDEVKMGNTRMRFQTA
jgi:pSer/pThr/pTyr-binding forkhead associated (FHA) protein